MLFLNPSPYIPAPILSMLVTITYKLRFQPIKLIFLLLFFIVYLYYNLLISPIRLISYDIAYKVTTLLRHIK